jgi:hypothetical protein
VRRDGDASRVDIRLTDARTGARVWSKTFEANIAAANLLATEDEISGKASAMIGSYWGAIGAAEFKARPDQVHRADGLRMYRTRGDRNLDRHYSSRASCIGA